MGQNKDGKTLDFQYKKSFNLNYFEAVETTFLQYYATDNFEWCWVYLILLYNAHILPSNNRFEPVNCDNTLI